jgi:hypothetical protein
MLTCRYRALIGFLVLLIVLADISGWLSAHRPHDIIATVLFVIAFILHLALVTVLVFRRDDWIFRLIVFIPIAGYFAFKIKIMLWVANC